MATKNIGDFLITFNNDRTNFPVRGSQHWETINDFGSEKILVTKPDDKWHGFPVKPFEVEPLQIWILGEIYSPIPDFPMHLSKLENLNGHYLVIANEKPLRRWHIITNRLGTMHAYIAGSGCKVSIGTFSPAVAAAAGCTDLEWSSIAGFFKFGFFLGDSTYWKGVRLLKPSTHLIIDYNGSLVSEDRYWRFYYQPDQELTYDEALEQFHSVFGKVLKDQVSGKDVALPLSGGLDSRSTFVELGVPGLGGAKSLFPFSYGYSVDSIETRIAARLASKRKLPIKTWTIQPYLFDQMHQIVVSTECFHDITQCRQSYVVDHLATYATHVLAAHWGDVWLDDMGFQEQTDNPGLDQLSDKLFNIYSKKGSEMFHLLFRDVFPLGWEDYSRDIIRESLHDLDITDYDFKIKAWKTLQWSHRWTLSSLRSYQVALFPILPFYDNRLTDFFCRLPVKYVKDRILQVDYLKQYAPDLAGVIWQGYDANLYQYKYFNTWLLPLRALKKLYRSFSQKSMIQSNWQVQYLDHKGKIGLNHWLLEKGLKIHNYLPIDSLPILLQDFYASPSGIKAYALSMLLTFSAWLENYG